LSFLGLQLFSFSRGVGEMWGGFVVALECAGEFFGLDPRPVFPHFGESLSALKRKRNVFSKEDLIANFTLVYTRVAVLTS
jgi:hypothetical protein